MPAELRCGAFRRVTEFLRNVLLETRRYNCRTRPGIRFTVCVINQSISLLLCIMLAADDHRGGDQVHRQATFDPDDETAPQCRSV